MKHGDYLWYKLNWETKQMRLQEVSPLLREVFAPDGEKSFPMSPNILVLERLMQLRPPMPMPQHFAIDVLYSRHDYFVNLRCTDDICSVMNISPERLHSLLSCFLTPRETEIATLMFVGHTIRYIAATLHIAEGTVKRTIFNIYQKVGVSSQVELIQEIYTRLAQLKMTPGQE